MVISKRRAGGEGEAGQHGQLALRRKKKTPCTSRMAFASCCMYQLRCPRGAKEEVSEVSTPLEKEPPARSHQQLLGLIQRVLQHDPRPQPQVDRLRERMSAQAQYTLLDSCVSLSCGSPRARGAGLAVPEREQAEAERPPTTGQLEQGESRLCSANAKPSTQAQRGSAVPSGPACLHVGQPCLGVNAVRQREVQHCLQQQAVLLAWVSMSSRVAGGE